MNNKKIYVSLCIALTIPLFYLLNHYINKENKSSPEASKKDFNVNYMPANNDTLTEKEKKVMKALEKFERNLEKISEQDLKDEQLRIAKAIKKYESIEVHEPIKQKIVDENGLEWVKLTYDNGEVRYEPVTENE